MPGPYQYPLENQDRCRSKIQFQAYQMIPSDITSGSLIKFRASEAYAKFATQAATDERDAKDILERRTTSQNIGRSSSETQMSYFANTVGAKVALATDAWEINNDAVGSRMKIKEVPGELCNLYMPISYTVNDGFSYDTGSLNMSGALLQSAINSGASNAFDAVMGGIQGAFSSTFDFFRPGVGTDAARLGLTRLANMDVMGLGVAPEGVRNAIPLIVGVNVNPNLRAIFKGVALRDFIFQFKFIAKSKPEAEQIKQIVQFFRRNAYPEDIPANADLSLGYKFPNMFKIKLMHKATDVNKYVPVGSQIKLCYIRNVQTQYNPQYAVFHSDGNPLEVDISISFTEYKTLSKQDIKYDYTDYDPDLSPPETNDYDDDAYYDDGSLTPWQQRQNAFADLANNQDDDAREP